MHRFCTFYPSAQRSVAGGILFLSCSSVRESVCAPQNIVNTVSCGVFDIFSPNLRQQCLWDIDERFTVWGQKVKAYGHGGIKYAGNSIFDANDVLWDKDECIKLWGQKDKLQV